MIGTMIKEWHDFLTNNGAELSESTPHRIETFGNPKREQHLVLNGNSLCDLTHYGLIKAEGEEAESFLQNQLTNDIRLIDSEHSQLNAYCTAKGRMMSIMRVFKRDDQYYLRLPQELMENTLERLRMFIMMTKVTLDDVSDELVRFGFAGNEAEQELSSIISKVPDEVDQVQHDQGISVIRLPGIIPRFEIYAELETAKSLWDKLNVRGTPVGAPAWELLEILSGTPEVYLDTVEAFVPQMVNLQLLDGVSLKKGCFPGQEIIARMHYLGKLKRRMYRLQITADVLPDSGTEIFTPEHNEPIGHIVSAATNPNGGSEALAVLVISFAEDNAALRLGNPDGEEASINTLPYSFEAA